MISLRKGSKVSVSFPRAETMTESHLHTKNIWPRRSFSSSIISLSPFLQSTYALNTSFVLAYTHNTYLSPRMKAQENCNLQSPSQLRVILHVAQRLLCHEFSVKIKMMESE